MEELNKGEDWKVREKFGEICTDIGGNLTKNATVCRVQKYDKPFELKLDDETGVIEFKKSGWK